MLERMIQKKYKQKEWMKEIKARKRIKKKEKAIKKSNQMNEEIMKQKTKRIK